MVGRNFEEEEEESLGDDMDLDEPKESAGI